MESQPKLDRSAITENYLQEFQDEIISRCNYGYGVLLEEILRESFHDKNVISEEKVFAFLENLEIGTNNAFLMRDKQKFIQIGSCLRLTKK